MNINGRIKSQILANFSQDLVGGILIFFFCFLTPKSRKMSKIYKDFCSLILHHCCAYKIGVNTAELLPKLTGEDAKIIFLFSRIVSSFLRRAPGLYIRDFFFGFCCFRRNCFSHFNSLCLLVSYVSYLAYSLGEN